MRFLGYSMPVLALRMTEPLIAAKTRNPDIWRLHVGALYTAGMYDDAMRALDGLLALVPDDPDALKLRQILEERKNAPAAPDTSAEGDTQ
jgi:regulator of sirC expression with transglutaminase-like and TPR domain